MTASTFQLYRWRIFGMVLLAFLPLLLLNLYTTLEQRRHSAEENQRKALALTRLAAAQQSGYVQSAHDLLAALSELIKVQRYDMKTCVSLLQAVHRQNPLFANFGVIEPDGELRCSVSRTAGRVNVSDRNYFQRAMQERRFIIGEYQIGRIVNKPVLPIALPILGGNGEVARVLFASIDLTWINQSLANVQLPPHGTIVLFDGQGTILGRQPEPQRWIGKQAGNASLVKAVLTHKQGSVRTKGLDDVERIYGFTPLSGVAPDLYLAIGLAHSVEEEINTAVFWRNLLIAVFTGLLSLTAAWFLINRDLRERESSSTATRLANDKLRSTIQSLEAHEREEKMLNDMRNEFQVVQTDEEIHAVIADHFSRAFPDCSGAIYLVNASRRLAESAVAWGAQSPGHTVFDPQDCLALRSGQLYLHDPAVGSFSCKHVHQEGKDRPYLCMPLLAHGEVLGTIHLLWPAPADKNTPVLASRTRELELIGTMGGFAALSLAHSRLLQALKNQAVRDPLTGLFNRRYMEETLERELARSRRGNVPLSILMLDIDHFKRFNDRYGHVAGDTVLVEVGSLLLKTGRSSDIACRYGGEELLLIMPDCGLDGAQHKAEQVLHEVRALEIRQNGKDLGRITISQGIAVFPQHGGTADELIRAADAALYRAKQEGRDRAKVANVKLQKSHPAG